MALNLDTNDIYEFEYQGNSILVENSELKATIILWINGKEAAQLTGFKAVTGIGKLEGKLPTGEIVAASIQKIKAGDSECTVTVNGTALTLKDHVHDKKDLVKSAKDAVTNAVKKPE